MKKFTALVLSCALFMTAFAGLSMTASAEGTPITFTAQSVTAKAGDIVTVDISVSENHYMTNGQLLIEYDPAALEIQETVDDPDNPYFEEINTKIFKSSYMWAFAVPEAGRAKFAFAASSEKGTTAGGKMFTLTFKVLENAADTTIAVRVVENDMYANDGVTANGEDYLADVTYVDGVVTVETAQVEGKLGDVNFDGEINLDDATTLFYHVNGLLTLQGKALDMADSTDDGTVDLDDATKLFYIVNGLISE